MKAPKPEKIDGTPGLQWSERADHWVATWVASRGAVQRGYTPKTVRLWPQSTNLLEPLADDIKKFVRSECQRLQRQMLSWSATDADDLPPFTGTLNSLIVRYMRDTDSPYASLRFASRRTYNAHFAVIEKSVGRSSLSSITGRHLTKWFKKWAAPATPGGPRRVPRAHACITMLRLVLSYGVALLDDARGQAQCVRLRTVLENLQFENGKRRTTEITAEQAVAVRRQAHAMGRPSIALAQAIMFDLTLRQKDAIGEWVPLDEPGLSDVTWKSHKWLYGVDWREVENMKLTHRLSKSLKGREAILDPRAGKTKVWNLTLYPMIMEELAHIPAEQRMGPIVINERTGLPWVYETFQQEWRKIATAAGVPKNVQNRDTRAGAITETIEVSDIESARIGAGHANLSTTQIYSRGDERRTAKVAVLRAKSREKND